ncbi:MAG: hypothetical protein ACRCS0_04920 [Albidovulum sp.]
MKLFHYVAIAFLASALPAMASQCPNLMKQYEEALATSTADDATKAKAAELYEKGKAEHESGDHAASEADLNEAIKLISG